LTWLETFYKKFTKQNFAKIRQMRQTDRQTDRRAGRLVEIFFLHCNERPKPLYLPVSVARYICLAPPSLI